MNLILLLISNALVAVGTGIAMILIPWLIASTAQGDIIFGTLITATNAVLFLIIPFLGYYIDAYARKKLMLLLRIAFIIGVALTLVINGLSTQKNDTFALAALVLYYCCGALFYAVNIPLRTAFVQELFIGRNYNKINTILEIENQIAAVATATLCLLLFAHADIRILASINILLYIISVICIGFIKTHPTAYAEKQNHNQNYRQNYRHVFKQLKRSVQIFLKRPNLALLQSCASMPYVIVIIYKYIHPVALSGFENTSAIDYAAIELLFGCGAILAGCMLQLKIIRRIPPKQQLYAAIFLFTAICTAQALLPYYAPMIILAFCLGLGNSLVRILRLSILMQEAPTQEIGRIGACLQSIIFLARVLLLATATLATAIAGITAALWIPCLVMGATAIITITDMKKQKTRRKILSAKQM